MEGTLLFFLSWVGTEQTRIQSNSKLVSLCTFKEENRLI